MARKKEDELSELETKILAIESFIAEKSCFGLTDGGPSCEGCLLKAQCVENVDVRLVKEEESLWEEEFEAEVDEELGILEDKPKEVDWGNIVKLIRKNKPTSLLEVRQMLGASGVATPLIEKSALVVAENLKKAGLIAIKDSLIQWL